MLIMETIENCINIIRNSNSSLLEKYNAIFGLRNFNNEEAAIALCNAAPFVCDSELLQHEIYYAVGQMGIEATIDSLISVLNDLKCSEVVRHEAGEALGNFPHLKEKLLPVLNEHLNSDSELVSTTAKIAVEKLKIYKDNSNNYNKYLKGTLEPAEPFSQKQYDEFLSSSGLKEEHVYEWILKPTLPEYTKYQVVYYYRDHFSEKTLKLYILLLSKDNTKNTTALLRHEINFIMGQLAEKGQTEEMRKALIETIQNENEHSAVRHEAVLAYSAVFGNDEIIKAQLSSSEPLVRESACILFN